MKIKYKTYIRICDNKKNCSDCLLYDIKDICEVYVELLPDNKNYYIDTYVGCFLPINKFKELKNENKI